MQMHLDLTQYSSLQEQVLYAAENLTESFLYVSHNGQISMRLRGESSWSEYFELCSFICVLW